MKGHDFSRANKANQICWALAPEGCFFGISKSPQAFSAARSAVPRKARCPNLKPGMCSQNTRLPNRFTRREADGAGAFQAPETNPKTGPAFRSGHFANATIHLFKINPAVLQRIIPIRRTIMSWSAQRDERMPSSACRTKPESRESEVSL